MPSSRFGRAVAFAGLALWLAAPPPAWAAGPPLVDASDPQLIVELMRGFGSARLDKAQDGSPMVRGRIDGDGFTLFFYGCADDGTSCTSIGFSSFFDESAVTPDEVNRWNAANRYGRAYLRDDGKPVLEMDVELTGGITADNFEATVDAWGRILGDFGASVVNRDRTSAPAAGPSAH